MGQGARQIGHQPPHAAFPSDLPALTSVRFFLALGWSSSTTNCSGRGRPCQPLVVLDRARLGVDVFFILSGFVLTHAYREALEARRLNYGRFLVARFVRISAVQLARPVRLG